MLTLHKLMYIIVEIPTLFVVQMCHDSTCILKTFSQVLQGGEDYPDMTGYYTVGIGIPM